MADLSFSQPERRNWVAPIAIVAVLAAAGFAAIYLFTPHDVAKLTVTHVAVVPNHTVFASGSNLVGARDQAEDDLYVAADVRVKDDLKLPVFIKDLSGTLVSADGGSETASAAEKNDFVNIFAEFPKVKQVASGAPLARETQIPPGGSAEGVVLLHFSVPQSVWDQRKSAVITVETYHQGPLTVTIPK